MPFFFTLSHYVQFIFLRMQKKFHQICQIYLRTVKLPYLTENGILNNFDIHGWIFKSDIFWVMAVANSRISGLPEETGQIRKFATVVTQNISDFDGQPSKSKLLRMQFLEKLRSLTVFRKIWWIFFLQNKLNIVSWRESTH